MNKNSRLWLIRISLGLAILLGSASLWATPAHEFTTGKLVDISSDERVDKGTTHGYTIYKVQLGDLVYFGRGDKLPKHPEDQGHGLIVGDPVQAAIDGKDMIIRRPDGKEIKTKIIKRERAAGM
jgi:hypothetical protein